MEKRIEEQLEGHKPGEIYELNLDNCETTQISGLTDEFASLETLTLTNNGLTSLKGFPKLPNLRKLDLSDNQLSDGLELLQNSQSLEYLILSGNQFKDLASLEPLKKIKSLQHLELYSCPVTEIEDYRSKVCQMIEEVLFIDGFDRWGHPAPNDDDDDDDDDDGDDDGGDDEDHGSEDEEGDSELEGEGRDEDDADDDDEGGARGTKRKHDEEEDDDD